MFHKNLKNKKLFKKKFPDRSLTIQYVGRNVKIIISKINNITYFKFKIYLVMILENISNIFNI